MRFITASALVVSFFASFVSGAAAARLLERADATGTGDVCGEVDDYLKVNFHGKTITIGKIVACLCISDIPHFVTTNVIAISASALVGKAAVTDALTAMVNKCGAHCTYPPHSEPVCKKGQPCGFDCKDGYTPYPSYKPTKCVCNKPYTECNGKCGLFHGCPSGHYYKRDALYGVDNKCPRGQTACGVFGGSSRAWECVDTQNDLESCGGCTVPLHSSLVDRAGVDCTAIRGVSDVSCVRGTCVVHRCRPNYKISLNGESCIAAEEKESLLLAEQYGLEHVPL